MRRCLGMIHAVAIPKIGWWGWAGCGSEEACSPPSGVMWVSLYRYVASFVFVFGFVVCAVTTPCICGGVRLLFSQDRVGEQNVTRTRLLDCKSNCWGVVGVVLVCECSRGSLQAGKESSQETRGTLREARRENRPPLLAHKLKPTPATPRHPLLRGRRIASSVHLIHKIIFILLYVFRVPHSYVRAHVVWFLRFCSGHPPSMES